MPAGLSVQGWFGWRWTVGLIVLAGLAAAAGAAGRGQFPPAPAVPWRGRLAALRRPFARRTLGVTLWTGVASHGLYTYLAEVAAARGAAAAVPVLIWAWGLGGMVGALFIGRVIDRVLSPARATSALLTLLAVGFALVGWAPGVGMAAGCFLWGLAGWASVAPQQHALVSRDPEHATAAVAWNSSANYLGGAVGAAGGSLLLDGHVPAPWLPTAALASVAVATHLAKLR